MNYRGHDIPVIAISSGAYYWCNTMESISIPESVGIEGGFWNPFYYCFALEKITVDEDNPTLKSVDGVLYSKDGKELLSYPAAKSGSTYTIPDEVESVYAGAFTGCRNLEKILVGEGNAYYQSIDGVLVDKENQLVAYPIGRKAISYSVPEEITQIAENAFYMSDLEEVVCKSVENISSEYFRQSSKLKKIEGGNLTKSIFISRPQLNNNCFLEIAGIDEMYNLEYLRYMGMPSFDYEEGDVTGNLQEWGKLENLKRVEVYGIHDSSGFMWLKNLPALEHLCVSCEKVDEDFLYICQDLPNLKSIEVYKIRELSDVLWVENLQALERFDISAESIMLKDFSQLFKLPNLEYVEINNDSENGELKEWFETKQNENPNMIIYYSEW